MKTLNMRFRTVAGTKTLRFPYVIDGDLAIACLSKPSGPEAVSAVESSK